MTTTFEAFKESSGIYGGNASYIEELYEQYLAEPQSVNEHWQTYFSDIKADSEQEVSRLALQEKFELLAQMPMVASGSDADTQKQIAVLNLISTYRHRAHLSAEVDPVGINRRGSMEEVEIKRHGLDDSDLDKTFAVEGAFGQQQMVLKELIDKLEQTYNHHIGVEISHVWSKEEKEWIIAKLESSAGKFGFSDEDKKVFLRQLVRADGLEKYLHRRYVGQKRFSLEGGDALIPLTQSIINRLSDEETTEIGIAMAHRGRLNMLINILGKTPQALFDEFEGKLEPSKNRSGDVKYHMGFSSRMKTDKGSLDITLAYNPSHLEFVNAVQMGSTRARLERQRTKLVHETGNDDLDMLQVANKAVPILIHGDAALAGQGINQEALQLSQLRGYQVGGSIHIVVNNQIGFTTSNLKDARSSMYCTDIAKAIQVPILHVNGDDPEAVVFAGEVATEYLLKFQKDVFIDLVCYRRLGHNEADEPSATQPMMYEKIRKHPVPAEVYAKQLQSQGVIDNDTYKQLQKDYLSRLESGESVALAKEIDTNEDELGQEWKALKEQDWDKSVDTTYDLARLQELGEHIFSVPEDFNAHKILERVLGNRREMVAGNEPLDWGAAENLAYASLLDQDYLVRLSGEDSGRGTFSHRHAIIHDQKTGDSYLPLAHIKDKQPSVRVIDSLLSEMGVLGFEYGYAIAEPKGLIAWEAQFGDFANGAQVIIDQFIAAGEAKWGRYCGLVMLLPHGYEGQGPEHSSARLERYLQLCANHNMTVAMPTTPAQIFHLLRLQVLRQFRKPLIVMSPKSLLRHKLATSDIKELAEGSFKRVIGEIDTDINAKKVKRIVLCSGKVYYDLLQKRRDEEVKDVALIRVEQLYPFPLEEIKAELAQYPEDAEYVWCQEEPRNQGAWTRVLESTLDRLEDKRIRYIGREESASTAAGYAKVHNAEQEALVAEALNLS